MEWWGSKNGFSAVAGSAFPDTRNYLVPPGGNYPILQ